MNFYRKFREIKQSGTGGVVSCVALGFRQVVDN